MSASAAEISSAGTVSQPVSLPQLASYLFVGLGTHENQPANRSVQFHQILDKHGIAHDYFVGGDGGHDWGTWRAHLAYMLPKLWRAKQASTATR